MQLLHVPCAIDPPSFLMAASALLVLLLLLPPSRSANAQLTGFVSIDCGSLSTTPYNDSLGIEWTPDSAIANSIGGASAMVQPPQDDSTNTRYTTIRYFPGINHTKYCYVLPIVHPGAVYLVRASFWLGSAPMYPTRASLFVSFKLLIDADEWTDIAISVPQQAPVVLEVYKRAISSTSVAVCLSGAATGSDTPFISSIELRPLNDQMTAVTESMDNTQRALHLLNRVHYGALTVDPPILRYPDDSLDRLWTSNTATPRLSTNNYINTSISDIPPLAVLQTAYVSAWSAGFVLNMSVDAGNQSYFFEFYFSEIDPNVSGPGQRVFDINVNAGETIISSVDVYSRDGGLYGTSAVYKYLATTKNYMHFYFTPAPTSTYPPFVSAMELLRSFDNVMSLGTFDGDIVAMDGIRSALVNLSSYTGDPCLPPGFAYPWLICSSATPARITNLSLSNFGLVGEIPRGINNLTGLLEILLDGNALEGSIPDLSALSSLELLNLSNNKLTGAIPSSLSSLPNLRYLYLENNNFGPIPTALLGSSTLRQFDYAGNPLLCTTSNTTCSDASESRPPRHIGLIIGLTVLGLVIAVLILGIMCCLKRNRVNKRQYLPSTAMDEHQAHVLGNTELVQASNAATVFSYKDIEFATDKFGKKLGEGGFGPVYEGRLATGRIVAIKVLSEDSRQGAREFLNEVGLLSRVHHKNLVGLLGYCTEQKLVLVYEYMSKGSLQDSLHGRSGLTASLTWRTRLRIALDAAQGLEYLHHGCSPRIIHRDVKSSNILLNEKLEAKIADFGISRFTSNDTGDIVATSMMGSMGYLDPEYTSTLRLTEKVDIYSFGVSLLEIMCGRPPILRRNHPKEELHIVQWVRPLIERGIIEEIVDPAIGVDYDMSSMWKVVEIAMTCVEFDGSKRPSMREVCAELREAIRMEFESDQLTHLQRTTDDPSSRNFSLAQVQAR